MWVYESSTLRFLAVNNSAVDLYGYTKEEFLSMTIKDIRPPEDLPLLLTNLSVEPTRFEKSVNWRHRKKDGSILHVEIISHQIVFESRQARLVLVNDVTDTVERAKKTDKLKTEFLHQISHEIRTPINALMGAASLLKDEISPENSDLVIAIDAASKRLLRTINLTLDMSQLLLDLYEVKIEKADLNTEIMLPLVKELKPEAASKGLKFYYLPETDETHLFTDKYCLTNILLNLIDNAIKFTKKGSVEVKVAMNDNNKLYISISDTGIGINKENLNKIFIPFAQEEGGLTRRYEGIGLGLSVVKKYCDNIGAGISIESKKGIGSTFTVTLSGSKTL